ncbi:hypothetical protein T492DRAFT_1124118 [Pavlovales sp. CCMP2436]|nr:hypothetical protein T492DRAFT_1124118 [Pavlovales sp. CCMP2436]
MSPLWTASSPRVARRAQVAPEPVHDPTVFPLQSEVRQAGIEPPPLHRSASETIQRSSVRQRLDEAHQVGRLFRRPRWKPGFSGLVRATSHGISGSSHAGLPAALFLIGASMVQSVLSRKFGCCMYYWLVGKPRARSRINFLWKSTSQTFAGLLALTVYFMVVAASSGIIGRALVTGSQTQWDMGDVARARRIVRDFSAAVAHAFAYHMLSLTHIHSKTSQASCFCAAYAPALISNDGAELPRETRGGDAGGSGRGVAARGARIGDASAYTY